MRKLSNNVFKTIIISEKQVLSNKIKSDLTLVILTI